MKANGRGRILKTKQNPLWILQHAIWHCKYGSKSFVRIPDAGDIAAIDILNKCFQELGGRIKLFD